MIAYRGQLLLGYAGALGFFAVATLVVSGYPVDHYLLYSNGILFFVAGTHWDTNPSSTSFKPLIVATLATTLIFLTIAGSTLQVITFSSVLYLILLWEDFKLFRSENVDKSYIAFRTFATFSALVTSSYIAVTTGTNSL